MAVSSTFKQQCPSCEAMISIKEAMVGKKVECTKCKDKFIAERPEEEEEEKSSAKKDTKAAGKKDSSAAVTSKAPAASKRSKLEVDDDVEENEPRSKAAKNGKSKLEVDDEEDEPREKSSKNGKSNGKPSTKERKDEEDEDEDETDGKKKKKTNKAGAGKIGPLVVFFMSGTGLLTLAVVGVLILGVAAFFVMKGSGPAGPKGGQKGGPIVGGNGDEKDPNIKPPPIVDQKPAGPSELNDTELARLSNLLPNDTEHVFHVFYKDLFSPGSSLHEAAFLAPNAIDDMAVLAHLGFSLQAIDDIIVAEKYTSPSWKYTVIHFHEFIKEDRLKAALHLEPVKYEGQTYYKTQKSKANPWLDQLARFSFGVPTHLRFFEGPDEKIGRPGWRRDKESVLRVHNAQTLIIADESPVKALLKAKGQFDRQSNKGGDKAGASLAPWPPGEFDRSGLLAEAFEPALVPEMGAPEFVSFFQVQVPVAEIKNPPMDPKKDPKNPPMDPKDPLKDPKDQPKDPPKDPKPGPNVVGTDMYMTIKPGLKAILDGMESRGADGKNKVLLSSATDMVASRVRADVPNVVWRRPRQFWDVTILLYENDLRIRNLGTALIQIDALKYQLRNELTCNKKEQAEEFKDELIANTSYKVARFIQSLTNHKVTLPKAEKKEGEQKPDDTKPPEATGSQITVKQELAKVEFVLDLVLDGGTNDRVKTNIAAMVSMAMRMELEAASNPSLRHALANGGRLLGEKFPPGAFERKKTAVESDQEPGNRISWMAGLLPHLGHKALFEKIQFNKSWRDPGNWMAGNTVVPEFLDPMYPNDTRQVAVGGLPVDFGATHYVGIAGVGMDAATYKRGDPRRGVFGYDDSASLEEVRAGRGASNLILMIQVPHDGEVGVTPWIAGGGYTLRGVPEKDGTLRGVPEKNSITPFLQKHTVDQKEKRGTYALMTDGSVRFISENVSDEVFKAMCMIGKAGDPPPKGFDLKTDPNTPIIPAPVVKAKEEPKKPPVEKEKPVEKKPEEKPVEKKPVEKEPDKKVSVPALDDAKLLQGVWIATSLEVGGKPAPAEMIKPVRLTFNGDKLLVRISAAREDEHTFRIDASKSPKHLDFTKVGTKQSSQCIYELKNGELKVHLQSADGPRPTTFVSQGTGIVAVLRKQTP